jgi:hypothetical protein
MTDQLRPGPLGHPPPAHGLLVDPHQVLPLVAEDGLGIQASTAPGSHVQWDLGGGAAALATARCGPGWRAAMPTAGGIREGWTDTQ